MNEDEKLRHEQTLAEIKEIQRQALETRRKLNGLLERQRETNTTVEILAAYRALQRGDDLPGTSREG